jgi:hypothetical protein
MQASVATVSDRASGVLGAWTAARPPTLGRTVHRYFDRFARALALYCRPPARQRRMFARFGHYRPEVVDGR